MRARHVLGLISMHDLYHIPFVYHDDAKPYPAHLLESAPSALSGSTACTPMR
jgi:hypothetical protein